MTDQKMMLGFAVVAPCPVARVLVSGNALAASQANHLLVRSLVVRPLGRSSCTFIGPTPPLWVHPPAPLLPKMYGAGGSFFTLDTGR